MGSSVEHVQPVGVAGDEAHRTRVAYLAVVASAACFGGTWVAGSVAVDAFPPFTIAAVRFATATIVLWAGARLVGSRLAPLRRADLPLVLGLGITAIAGYNLLFLSGLSLAPATDGAIIVPGTAPVVTMVIAARVLGERLRLTTLAGVLVSLAGLLLVVRPEIGGGSTRLPGDLLFLGGAVLWGTYSVLSRIASRRFDPVSITLYGAAAGTLLLVAPAIAEGGPALLVTGSVSGWLGIGYLALIGTVAGFILFQVGIRTLGASRTASFAYLVPIFGVSSSALFLGEPLAPLTLVGGGIVLAGLWLVQRPGSR